MRFTVITFIDSLWASLVYSAAPNPATLSSLAARAPDVEDPNTDVVAYALPNGHRKIDFYLDGALTGSVVETNDGAEFFDENGDPFSIDDADLEKRQSLWQLAVRFAKIFARWVKPA